MIPKISCHGAHSGEFCVHAHDSLSEIVSEYHAQDFACVCLTEHMPPECDDWLYPDERAAGLSAKDLRRAFKLYLRTARTLAADYAGRMTVLVGMETEWYPGAWAAITRWRGQLDLIVGSVHHVGGIDFDYSLDRYEAAARAQGGLVPLYEAYFDAQYAMLRTVVPHVVGHLDLIRLYDPNYIQTLAQPSVWGRVQRNLLWIREKDLILDVNARALLKKQPEPYVCRPILELAADLGIRVAPGDDSHGVDEVGQGLTAVGALLARIGLGADLNAGDFGSRWARFFSRQSIADDWNRPIRCRP